MDTRVTILLEELGIDYNIVPININNGDQFGAEFLKISPNNRIPAIVDHAPQKRGRLALCFRVRCDFTVSWGEDWELPAVGPCPAE